MSEVALDILKKEHRAISAVLYCFKHVVDEVRHGDIVPPFQMFHAVLDYLTSFPNRFHHPKEDWFLFPIVAQRAPDTVPAIETLKKQHVEGEEKVDELKDQLAELEDLWDGHWTDDGEARFATFADTVDAFVEFERQHARMEGVEIMPRAKETFTEEDWAGVEAAFSANEDPVFGQKPRQRFDALYRKIVALAPSPMGYADREAPEKEEPEEEDREYWFRQQLLNLNWI